MQIWIHDNKMRKITALNNDIPDMLSYTNSTWHSYLDQATSTFDFTIPKISNGELHEDLKLINDECFVSFYVNGSYQVFYIATLQEDDFNIQLTCNNTNLEYALEYANPFNSSSAQSIQWYLEHMDLLSFAAVEIGNNEIPDRKRTLTFDSQETKMNRLQSLMSKFEAEFEFKVELNRDGTYKRIVINIYQEADDTHHGIGTDRKDVVLYYSNGLKGVQVTSDKTQMFNAGVFDGKDGVNLANVEFSEKNAEGVEEFYSRKGDIFVYAPLSMQRYPATMKPDGQDNWIRKDFQTEYENVNDLKAYALRTLKKYAYPLVTYTASVQSGFVSHYTDLKLGDTIRIIDKNFVGGLALEARVSEMIISFDNPANNSFVFTNYRKLDNKPSSALQTRIDQAVESKLPYRIELATTGGVTFKNNEGETIIKPSLYKGNLLWTKDVTWRWALDGVVTVGMQYLARAENIDGTAVLTVSAYVGNNEVATTEITLTDVDDGLGVESIDRYFTSSDKSDGVTIEGTEWSDKPPAPTEDGKYLWAYDEITYTDGSVTTTKPAAVGANFDVDAFRAEIAEDLKDVPNREEFENKIAEELANSKAEIETQIETAKTQAESNAKEYADTINQETAKVAELANAAADEIKADLVNVKNNLTDTSLVANNAQAAVDAAKQELTEVANELSTAKQDLTNSVAEVNTKVNSTKAELTQAKQDLLSHAQQLQTQANAQSELTKRVTTVETTANGTKTTVSELTKTVAQNGKDITSVTARTKTVEDDLTSTKTTLSQVQTTADGASSKAATLETGLNGIKADLAATTVTANTTKTNLANYQASNDRAVANLQSNLQEANGNISSLKTKVEAVPGQITSAVSAVEGKIPTSIGGRNLWIQSKVTGGFVEETLPDNHITGQKKCYRISNNNEISFNIEPDFSSRLYRKVTFSAWVKYENVAQGANNWNVFNCFKHSLYYKNSSTGATSNVDHLTLKGFTGTSGWKHITYTYDYSANKSYDQLKTSIRFNLESARSGTAWITGIKVELGSIPSDYSPAPEDTAEQISKLSSEIKQTADGMTLLATKTELNSAKTELQSGINTATNKANSNAQTISTHTTQISALNTGLQAKVSQTDFNTLSGRVTTAENNITAKANELSSKITTVEGKIPTSIGGRNLWIQSKATGNFVEETLPDNHITGQKVCYRMNSGAEMRFIIEPNFSSRLYRKVTFSAWIKYENVVQGANSFNKFNIFKHSFTYRNSETGSISGVDYLTPASYTGTADWQYVHFTVDYSARTDYNQLKGSLIFNLEGTKSGTAWITGIKVELGSIPSDYSPAPEDTAEQISKLSSEIKQTADGMTLLATKTELNSAKTELQSGINTATNKANNAQATANSNAQIISTHTTQISALNTGLSAKVSQSDFNTLSGRVTTAENNITAKANELSSKITTVEGKIPTSIGGRNLWIQSKVTGGFVEETLPDNHITGQKKCYRISNNNEISFNIEPDFSSRLYRKVTFSAWVKYENVAQGANNWNVFNCFKHSLYYKNSSTGATSNVDHLTLKGFTGTSGWKHITYTYDYSANKSYDQLKTSIRFNLESARSGTAWVTGIKIEIGSIPSDYSPAPEDYDSKLATAQSEFKQTTDTIKASVQSLDNSTVKSSSLTINADGIVMKAGKSTTDVANAIGSYFAVNQNAINLFSDKINVKGSMIVNGAITSDKIASKSINTAHLNGKIITADVISSNAVTANAIKAGAVTTDKMSANSINGDRIAAGTLDAAKIKAGSISASQIASGTLTSAQIKAGAIKSINIEASAITSDKIAANSISSDKIVASGITANVIKGGTLQSLNGSTNFELDSGKLFYNNNNTGVFRVQNGASTMGLKFSNTPITVNGASRILSRAILGGDRNENTLDDGKWDKGGFSGLVIETIKGAIPAVNEHADSLRAISDTIYFTHTYSADSPTGVSAHGWKMETYAPDSSISGNIVLKPYGINYRQSDIVVGDIRLDNGDGSGYWMRATINTLKACFGHILNGGTSSSALNAIRSELDKISGT